MVAAHQARSSEIFDLISDPKEEYGAILTASGWVGGPMMRIVSVFEASLKRYPPYRPHSGPLSATRVDPLPTLPGRLARLLSSWRT